MFYVALDGTKGEVEAEEEYIKRIALDAGGVLADRETAKKFVSKYTEQWCGARALTGFEDVLTTHVPMECMKEFYDILWNQIAPKYGISPLPGEKYSLDVGRHRMAGGRYALPKGDHAWENYQKALREIAKLATSMGGSVQSCHGVGIEHRDNMEIEFSEVALETMRRIKRTLDPDNIMNPGKKIPEKK